MHLWTPENPYMVEEALLHPTEITNGVVFSSHGIIYSLCLSIRRWHQSLTSLSWRTTWFRSWKIGDICRRQSFNRMVQSRTPLMKIWCCYGHISKSVSFPVTSCKCSIACDRGCHISTIWMYVINFDAWEVEVLHVMQEILEVCLSWLSEILLIGWNGWLRWNGGILKIVHNEKNCATPTNTFAFLYSYFILFMQ